MLGTGEEAKSLSYKDDKRSTLGVKKYMWRCSSRKILKLQNALLSTSSLLFGSSGSGLGTLSEAGFFQEFTRQSKGAQFSGEFPLKEAAHFQASP